MSNGAPRAPDASYRVIRVFVSSTFSDMQAERDELVKRVFPRLRKRCEERGVTWGEVDLRWGITDEQKAEGKVLPICLAEIERCRPYFIGLLGERYGWIPEDIEPGLIEQQPWLREHRERSVTELEVDYGVLLNPDMAGHAFFYLRDPAYLDEIPKELLDNFREGPSDEEIERLGKVEAERRADQRRHKLQGLKARIRASGLPVRDGYPDPRALGELVLFDFSELIDRLYPEGSRPDPLDREADEHNAFARNRSAVYIARREYFERLDTHATGKDPPLAVLGESGSGKSALLANWALEYRRSHPNELTLTHFIGSSPHSTDWAGMLRRIMGELGRHLRVQGEIPDQPDELRRTFADWLRMAAARGRVVLVLDALNQLEDRDGAPDLVWLPPHVPANVRLIASTLPGRPLEEIAKRGWPTLQVEPLERHERQELIINYLHQYSRAISPEHLGRIARAPQAGNPLYLRAVLEELRVWGDHATLGDRIDHYLRAGTIEDLYELILARYEEDYEDGRPGLVGGAMAVIWAARRGLSEAELLDLLGSDGEPLPAAQWSPLHLAAEQSLISRSGLIGFTHEYLRQAVGRKYLLSRQDQEAAHLRLAGYFDSRREESRGVEELPWQLAEAGSWQRLYELLADPGFFGPVSAANEWDAKNYWTRIESNSSLRLVDAYRPLLDDTARDPDQAWLIAEVLYDTGHLSEALKLRQDLVEHYRRSDDRERLQASLGNQALIHQDRGELDQAMALLNKQERICRALDDRKSLHTSLGNQAVILQEQGKLAEALALLKEQEDICRALNDRDGLQRAIGNQGAILQARGELDEAMALLKEKERICRELGSATGLQNALGNQAMIAETRGDLDQAMALLKEQERICRDIGYLAGLQGCLGNQGLILRRRGDLDGAMALHKEEERIARELGDLGSLQRSLGNQALIHSDQGRLDEAMALHKEEERICREVGYLAGLQASLGNQAVILQNRGELDAAMDMHKDQERIARDLGDRQAIARSLGNQGVILQDRGRLEEAMALHKEKERICRDIGYLSGLHTALSNQAAVLKKRGQHDEAMRLLKEGEEICRKLADPSGLALSLTNQGVLLGAMGRTKEGLSLVREAHRMATDHGLTALVGRIEPVLRTMEPPKGPSVTVWLEEEAAARFVAGMKEISLHPDRATQLIQAVLRENGSPEATDMLRAIEGGSINLSLQTRRNPSRGGLDVTFVARSS